MKPTIVIFFFFLSIAHSNTLPKAQLLRMFNLASGIQIDQIYVIVELTDQRQATSAIQKHFFSSELKPCSIFSIEPNKRQMIQMVGNWHYGKGRQRALNYTFN